MSSDPTSESTARGARQRGPLVNTLPWVWLGLSAVWAVVILATDQVAWPLALWIATTVGPLTALKTRFEPNPDPRRSNR